MSVKLSCFPLSSCAVANHLVTQPNKTHQHGYYIFECILPKLELRWMKSHVPRWVCSLFWCFFVLLCRADNFHRYNWILPFTGKPLWGFTEELAHSRPFYIALCVVLGLSKSHAFFFFKLQPIWIAIFFLSTICLIWISRYSILNIFRWYSSGTPLSTHYSWGVLFPGWSLPCERRIPVWERQIINHYSDWKFFIPVFSCAAGLSKGFF